jgi:hypothetical protein
VVVVAQYVWVIGGNSLDTVAIVIPGMNEASSTRGGLNRCSELQNSHLLDGGGQTKR